MNDWFQSRFRVALIECLKSRDKMRIFSLLTMQEQSPISFDFINSMITFHEKLRSN